MYISHQRDKNILKKQKESEELLSVNNLNENETDEDQEDLLNGKTDDLENDTTSKKSIKKDGFTFFTKINSEGINKKKIKEEDEENYQFAQDWLPIKDIQSGIIITTDNRYIKILEIEPINFKLRSKKDKDNIINTFYSWLKIAPVKLQFKTTVQKADPQELINNIYKKTKNETNERFLKKRDDYITYIKHLSTTQALVTKFYFIYEYEGAKSKEFDEIRRTMQTVKNMAVSYFGRIGNEIIDHNPEKTESFQAAELLYRFLNRKSSSKETFDERVQRIAKDTLITQHKVFGIDDIPEIDVKEYLTPRGIHFDHSKYIIVDGMYMNFLYINSDAYPTTVTSDWTSILTQYGEGVDVDMYFQKEDTDSTKRDLKQRGKLKRATLRNGVNSQDKREEISDNIQVTDFIKQKMQDNEELYYATTILTIYAPTYRQLMDIQDNVVSTLNSSDIKTTAVIARHEECLKMTLPLCYINKEIFQLSKRNFLTSSVASSYLFTSYSLYDPTGFVIGLNSASSALAAINNFNTRKYSNANVAIIGATGAGKTYTQMTVGYHMRLTGYQVINILPIKGFEYAKATYEIGGTFISLSADSKDRVNIMAIRPTNDIDERLLAGDAFIASPLRANKINQLMTFIELLNQGKMLEPNESVLLENALVKVYETYGITADNNSIWEDKEKGILKVMPIISDWYDEIKDDVNLEKVSVLLLPFIEGMYKNFNGQTNIDVTNKYLTFDVSAIADKYKPAFLFIAMDCAYDIIKQNRTENVALFMDEVWKMMLNESSAKFVDELVRIVRGYGGASILATQKLEDLVKNEISAAILGNIKIKIILKLEDNEADIVQQMLYLTEKEKKHIVNFTKGQAMIVANGDKAPVLIRATADEHDIFNTDANENSRYVEKLKYNMEKLNQKQAVG